DASLGRLIEAVPPDTVLVVLGDHGENLTIDLDLRLGARLRRPWHRRLGWLWQPVVLKEFSGAYHLDDRRLKARLARGVAGILASVQKPPSRHEFYRRWVPGHGETLYDEAMRVPLLLVGPDLPACVVEPQVRTVDIFPTLLELAGLQSFDAGQGLDGRSLIPLIADEADDARPAFMQTGGGNLPDPCLLAHGLRTPEYKYVYTPAAHGAHFLEELYDLRADPGETRNIIGQTPAVAARMRAECDALAAAGPLSEPEDSMTAEEEAVLADRLRQLGYLE
ncbi:MAG TPA: sulfatase/phosphatase domain-containing protein, partial [Gemmataceae bacterium]|nr:sulfatase/phosphatase domain-containing protein [Gemmataceae bacterium]